MAGIFDNWNWGGGMQGGGQGILPEWLLQTILQGAPGASEGFPGTPPLPPKNEDQVPQNAQFAMMQPQPQIGGYEPRRSIFDRPDSIPGDRMDGAPPAFGPPMQAAPQAPGATAMAQYSPMGGGAPSPQQSQFAQNAPAPSTGGGLGMPQPPQGMGMMGLLLGKYGRAMEAQQLQQYERQKEAWAVNVTDNFLDKRGVPPEMRRAIIANPAIAREVLPQLFGKPEAPLVVNGKLVDRSGKLIADYSKDDKPMVVTEGGSVYDPNTREFKQGPRSAPKPANTHRWVDENDLSKGQVAIEGGPATDIPVESAGRLALLKTARGAFDSAKSVLMRDRGAFGMNSPVDVAKSFASAGDVGNANRSVKLAIESALRAATGAVAPPSEVENYAKMFMPIPADSDKTTAHKLGLLENFLKNQEAIAMRGRSSAPPSQPSGSDPLGLR